MTDCTKLDQEVEALANAIWDVAFKVWEFAELGYQEFQSSAYEAEALEKAGFIISDRGSGTPVLGYLVEIEALLKDRDYTVFAAHTHKYNYTQRYGRDYITTAMTGAMNVPRLGAIDHVVWVTMTQDGPKIANLLLNGILDKKGPVEGDLTEKAGMYRPKA